MRKRTLVLITMGVAAAAWAASARRPDRLAIQSAVIRAVTAEDARALQRTPLAGMSARSGLQVKRLNDRAFRGDTTAEYHHFRHRCISCHDLPAPEQHDGQEWAAVVSRMNRNLAAAGLLGLTEEERVRIWGFLARNATPPRSR